MDTSADVQCPYCYEIVNLYVDPETLGNYVEDCYVCCRPWAVSAQRDHEGQLIVHVSRAQ